MTIKAHYIGIHESHRVRGTAVVIDVLRAFTTAAYAFHLGAERIVLSDAIDDALQLKAALPGALALKDSKPVEGFELSNSPVELQARDLRGCTIVQQTTHGTVGAVAAKAATDLYCASFVLASATAAAVQASGASEVYFVVTGENGAAEEDLSCAEYIAALIDDPATASEPYVERARRSNVAAALARRVEDGVPGVHPRDLDTCLEANIFDFVMRAREEPVAGRKPLILRAYNQGDA
jgi:2-phosphosulfolactate phosphatase